MKKQAEIWKIEGNYRGDSVMEFIPKTKIGGV